MINCCNYIVVTCSRQKGFLTLLNLKKDYPISIIVVMIILEKTSHCMTNQLPTLPDICFCTTGGKQNK